jgi:8-amino-7-oxononanoate synthase
MTWKKRIQHNLQIRQQQNLWRKRIPVASPSGRLVEVAGKPLLNFCGNDYLGLAHHPELIAAGSDALLKWGTGSGASHLICGHSELHEQLEHELAAAVGAESALVFSTGYMANLAIPQTFLDRHGLLVADKLNHASLLDAGKLCDAKMKRYPHLDVAAAETLLAPSDEHSEVDQKLLVTDGVFSMDGDVAPVGQLKQICDQHDALLVVDDAHGFGVLGETGAGLLQQAGIAIKDNVLMMGTLGKTAGSFGAFVAGDAELIEALIQFARPYIYTTALPPAVAATSLAAIKIIREDSGRRQTLRNNVDYFRSTARQACLPISDSPTPIQPLLIGESTAALRISEQLHDAGIWVTAIRPPTVPAGSARLRITLSAHHTHADIDLLVQSLAH